jgi:cbb3-type cytochrome c oxidase subunit III
MTTKRSAIRIFAGAVLVLAAVLLWRHHVYEEQARMMRTDPDAILTTPGLCETALKRGKEVFAENCASCHGADAKGSTLNAVPDMTDDHYLYGQNTPSEIEQIVLHGIRAGDSKGWNLADMPGFAKAVPYKREKLPSLTPDQIDDLVAFLRAANGNGGYDRARVDRGRTMFATTAGCWDCHGGDGAGDPAIGAPNLVDGKWLKGDGSEADIRHTLERGLANVSPAFFHRLSAYDARVVSVYTASLHPPTKPAQ